MHREDFVPLFPQVEVIQAAREKAAVLDQQVAEAAANPAKPACFTAPAGWELGSAAPQLCLP